jgi:MFS family permease
MTTKAPLRRNRDFMLFQVGQLLSTAGTQSAVIAYPLLVLAVTHSPAKAGIVSFARLLPQAAFGVVAGVAADRWSRRRLMVSADSVRAVAVAGFAVAIVSGRSPGGRFLSLRSSTGAGRHSSQRPSPEHSVRSCPHRTFLQR